MSRAQTGLGLALLAHLVLGLVAIRHHFFWGAERELLGQPLFVWLNGAECAGLLLFTALGALGWQRLVQAAPTIAERTLVLWGIGLALAAFAVPPVFSTDVFDYLARGHLAVHLGHNPYTTPPGTVPQDAILAMADWPHYVCVYGPIAALASCASAALGGSSAWLGAYVFKLLTAAAHVGAGVLVARAAGEANRRTVLALWLFHPFLALESCGSGHNDALMALALAWMVERLARDRWGLATFAFGLAVLTKHGCAPLGPILLCAAIRSGRLRPFLTGCGATLVLTAGLALVFWREPGSLGFLGQQAANQGASLIAFGTLAFGAGATDTLHVLGLGVALAAITFACVRVRDARSFATEGAWALGVFLMTAMALFSPWYHLWWVPLIGLAPRTGSAVTALRVLAWAGPLAYVVYAGTRSLDLPHQVWTWGVAGALPTVWLLRRKA